MSLARFEPTPGNQTWKLRVAPRERPTISAGMDGSVTPKSLQAAIGLCHMGRSATPTEEIQMMQQHEIFSPAEATGPPPLLANYVPVPDTGEVDQFLTISTVAAVEATTSSAMTTGLWRAAEEVTTAAMAATAAATAAAAAAAATATAAAAAAAAAATAAAAAAATLAGNRLNPGMPPHMEGGVFIDKHGQRFD